MMLMLCLLSTINTQYLEVTPIQAKNGYLIFQTETIDLPINHEYHYLSITLLKQRILMKNLLSSASLLTHFAMPALTPKNRS